MRFSNGFDAFGRRRTKAGLVAELSRVQDLLALEDHMHSYQPCHVSARVRVNYVSCEMSNCSPYRKIYNSARCGKHYVLSGPSSSTFPLFFPLRSPQRESSSSLFCSASCSHYCRLDKRLGQPFLRRRMHCRFRSLLQLFHLFLIRVNLYRPSLVMACRYTV